MFPDQTPEQVHNALNVANDNLVQEKQDHQNTQQSLDAWTNQFPNSQPNQVQEDLNQSQNQNEGLIQRNIQIQDLNNQINDLQKETEIQDELLDIKNSQIAQLAVEINQKQNQIQILNRRLAVIRKELEERLNPDEVIALFDEMAKNWREIENRNQEINRLRGVIRTITENLINNQN